MATVAAKNMALAAAAAQFAPLPCIQLKFLHFSWTFYGVAEGNKQSELIYTSKQTHVIYTDSAVRRMRMLSKGMYAWCTVVYVDSEYTSHTL
jgi:hypothetical protein